MNENVESINIEIRSNIKLKMTFYSNHLINFALVLKPY